MILSENRFPLFGIMLQAEQAIGGNAGGPDALSCPGHLAREDQSTPAPAPLGTSARARLKRPEHSVDLVRVMPICHARGRLFSARFQAEWTAARKARPLLLNAI